MNHWSLYLVILSAACAAETEVAYVLADPAASIEQVCTTLDEAARLGGGGEREAGLEVWQQAHAKFDTELAPWITQQEGTLKTLTFDYQIGQVRAEMGRQRGHPRDVATAFAAALRALSPAQPAS